MAQPQWMCQETGDRQGCPLSPSWFLMSMSTMWADIRADTERANETVAIPGVDFGEIPYADDTAVVTYSAEKASKVLQVVDAFAGQLWAEGAEEHM